MLLGIDVGTQSLKVVATDLALRPRGEAASAYEMDTPRPGWAEQDPRHWLAALGPTIARALARAGASPRDVRGIGVSGQLDGCVAVDAAGEPLASCLIWMDRRAAPTWRPDEVPALRARTGIVPDPIHMGPKIGCLDAALATRPARYHQPVSFLVQRLCGAAVMDRALASTTLLYDLATADYADDLLALFGVGRDRLPLLADCAALAGRLHAGGAALTGLPPGTPVAVGTGDDFAGAFGGGVILPGTLACTLGTAEVVGALHPAPLIDPLDLVETHPFPSGNFFLENPGWLCTGAVEWLRRTLSLTDAASVHALAACAPPGCDGLLFLPAMTGAMAPRWVPGARGAYYGLTPAHGPAHLARAMLEGSAFAMRDVLDRLEVLGVPVGAIRLMGGGARSEAWAQMRADIAGRPVEVLGGCDTSCLGAAACAAVAAGLAPSLVVALASSPGPIRRVEPDAGRAALYQERHAAYLRLFGALTPLFSAP